MPNDNVSDFDAELTAMLNGGEETSTPQESVQQNQPVEAAELKYGGRVWKDAGEIGKAYESALRKMTQATQEASRLKPYGDFDTYLNKHPELRQEFNILWNNKVQEYQKRIGAGQSEATAQKATGISPEYAERIERIEAHFETQKVQSEVSDLKSKFNLDSASMDNVLSKAIELEERGVTLPLTDVYKILAFEEKKLEARKEGQKSALDSLKGKRKANVGGSDLTSANPSAKGISEMTGADMDKAILDRLEGLGYSG